MAQFEICGVKARIVNLVLTLDIARLAWIRILQDREFILDILDMISLEGTKGHLDNTIVRSNNEFKITKMQLLPR
jgi:hypothetical protein